MIGFRGEQHLDDILSSINSIDRYVAGKTVEIFKEDDLCFDAVVMRLQVIGESVAKLPKELLNEYPSMPWKQIIGLRNYISHAYSYLDAERVWLVIKNDLPNLKMAIVAMMRKLEE